MRLDRPRLTKLIQPTDSSHGGNQPCKTTGAASNECENTITVVQRAFASILDKKGCLENIYQGCYRLDDRQSGEIEISALLQVGKTPNADQLSIFLNFR